MNSHEFDKYTAHEIMCERIKDSELDYQIAFNGIHCALFTRKLFSVLLYF